MVFLNLQIAQIAQGLTDYGFVSGDGGVGVIFSDTEPVSPEDAQLWLSSLTNELKIFNGVSWQYVSLTVAEKSSLASLTTAVLDAQLAATEAEAARDSISALTAFVTSVAGRQGDVILSKVDVGLANVDNTSDSLKPVSTATQTALDLKSDATHNHNGVYEPIDSTILRNSSIGSSVQAYDATILNSSNIGSTVQAYDVDTAKLDAVQTFTAAQRSTITTDNDLSFNMTDSNKFKCTPTALGTLTFINLTTQSGTVILYNSTGYSISLAASIKAKNGVATTLSTAGVYLIGYDCDGTNVYITVSAAMV